MTPIVEDKGIGTRDAVQRDAAFAELRRDDALLRQAFDLKVFSSILTLAFVLGIQTTTFSHVVFFNGGDKSQDLGIGTSYYSWLRSAPYLLQIPLHLPIAPWILYHRFPLDKFASLLIFGYTCTFNMMAFGGATALMAGRVLQGLLEPCLVSSLVMRIHEHWRREEVPRRMGFMFSMFGLATAFMSLFSATLTSFASESLLYDIVFNGPIIVFSIYVFGTNVFSSSSHMDLKFLSDREEEAAYGLGRLCVPRSVDWNKLQVREAREDAKTWFYFAIGLLASIPASGMSCLGPLILMKGGSHVSHIMLNVPFALLQAVVTIMAGQLAAKYRISSIIISLSLTSMLGLVVLTTSLKDSALLSSSVVAGYYLSSCSSAIAPSLYSWAGLNTAGVTKQKATISLIFVGQSLGSVLGPLILNPGSPASVGTVSLYCFLAAYIAVIGLSAAARNYIQDLNARRLDLHIPPRPKQNSDSDVEPPENNVLDFEWMESPEGVYKLTEYCLPYLFQRRVYDDLTDIQDKEFRYTT